MRNEKRREQILILLSSKSIEAMTITQIHDELYEWFGLDVCRKTITRDVDSLLKSKDIIITGTYPPRYYKSQNCSFNFRLTVHEITQLLTEVRSKFLRDKFQKYI